ncbi:hypothetical protein C8Q70DRAFT_648572 [Cubamyces menziesii]|nr:hypothetical protein C8Q70DRAFT_648572 [Cubamyces menziesii]
MSRRLHLSHAASEWLSGHPPCAAVRLIWTKPATVRSRGRATITHLLACWADIADGRGDGMSDGKRRTGDGIARRHDSFSEDLKANVRHARPNSVRVEGGSSTAIRAPRFLCVVGAGRASSFFPPDHRVLRRPSADQRAQATPTRRIRKRARARSAIGPTTEKAD